MAKRKTVAKLNLQQFERIALEDFQVKRRGKHHDFIDDVLKDLQTLPGNEAIKIPLSAVADIPLANIRSAINRATVASGVSVRTYSDREYLYIWKR